MAQSKEIYRERIPSTDPRLKRHINHDSRSRLYPYSTEGLVLQNTAHTRYIPILDQGHLGSCTGNAGIGCLGTGLFYHSRGSHYSLDEGGAVALYSDATKVDPYAGEYPPFDTGSDGLTIAKVLKSSGEISGYQHTFTLDDALKTLTATPIITGTNWYTDMFHPDADGRVRITGQLAGGHEYVADQLDVDNERVWFSNSWGSSWGREGRFYLTWQDYGELLGQGGDVTVFVPVTAPAPTPTPPSPPTPDPADVALVQAVREWAGKRHARSNAKAAAAVRAWMDQKGF